MPITTQRKFISDFEASESEDLTSDNDDLPFEQQITLKASKITDSGSDFDEIYKPYIGSKQTRVVCRQKPMTSTNKKLEEVHVDLWGPHDPASLSGSVYAAILICEKTRKTWVLYLCSKNEFVDAFQVWLPKVENESNYTMNGHNSYNG